MGGATVKKALEIYDKERRRIFRACWKGKRIDLRFATSRDERIGGKITMVFYISDDMIINKENEETVWRIIKSYDLGTCCVPAGYDFAGADAACRAELAAIGETKVAAMKNLWLGKG